MRHLDVSAESILRLIQAETPKFAENRLTAFQMSPVSRARPCSRGPREESVAPFHQSETGGSTPHRVLNVDERPIETNHDCFNRRTVGRDVLSTLSP